MALDTTITSTITVTSTMTAASASSGVELYAYGFSWPILLFMVAFTVASLIAFVYPMWSKKK